MADQFYLQDSRSYIGNDMNFWARDGGYTTDLRKARVYTKEEALAQHKTRESDIPWPKDYIDERTRPAVDYQYCRRDEALRGTGIKLTKRKHPRRPIYNCAGCGRFLAERDYYGCCPCCGMDNRP